MFSNLLRTPPLPSGGPVNTFLTAYRLYCLHIIANVLLAWHSVSDFATDTVGRYEQQQIKVAVIN